MRLIHRRAPAYKKRSNEMGEDPTVRRIAAALCASLLVAFGAEASAEEDETYVPALDPTRPRVGLVLSGGGARGLAHIGVLKVLQELRVPVDFIAATSMGSIVGGGYAAGYTPDQLEALVNATDWREIFARRAPREDLHFRRKEDDFKNLSDIEFGITNYGLTLPRGAVGTQNLGLFLRALGGPVRGVNDLTQLPISFAAMATDLATGRLVVLQKDVSLASAMRASMSVPGAFAPFELNGQVLVDGGLVRNLPVDIARKMGAEIIIAVNVGTPPMPREKLTDVLAVTEQMVNILGEQNVERSMAELQPQDILIKPDLSGLASSDFNRGELIRKAGEDAARAVSDRLRELAVSEAQFVAYERARSNPVREDIALAISEVRIDGLRKVDAGAVRAELDLPHGKPMRAAEIDRAIQRVFGRGDFESVSYSLIDDPLGRRLVVTPFEKSWGYNAVRFGGNIVTGIGATDSFNLLAAHTWSWINSAGGEWRNELQIGNQRLALTEFYQPLYAGSRLFILPRMWARRENADVFIDRVALFNFESRTSAFELQMGQEFIGLGTARVTAGRLRSQLRERVGEPIAQQPPVQTDFAGAEFRIDTVDSVAFPRRGQFLSMQYLKFRDRLVGSQPGRSRSVDTLLPFSLGRYTIIAAGRYSDTGQELGERLGGPFNLTGTRLGEIAGARSTFGRLFIVRNVSDAFGEIVMPVYLGASLETGYARGGALAGPSDWQRAASIFLGADSILGPLYLIAGRTFGGGAALYIMWGQAR
jgi:NTE family protein